MSPSLLSYLERGERKYTEDTLNALAHALGCDPGDLLRPPPDHQEAEIIDLLRKLDGERRKQAYRLVRAIIGEEKPAAEEPALPAKKRA